MANRLISEYKKRRKGVSFWRLVWDLITMTEENSKVVGTIMKYTHKKSRETDKMNFISQYLSIVHDIFSVFKWRAFVAAARVDSVQRVRWSELWVRVNLMPRRSTNLQRRCTCSKQTQKRHSHSLRNWSPFSLAFLAEETQNSHHGWKREAHAWTFVVVGGVVARASGSSKWRAKVFRACVVVKVTSWSGEQHLEGDQVFDDDENTWVSMATEPETQKGNKKRL